MTRMARPAADEAPWAHRSCPIPIVRTGTCAALGRHCPDRRARPVPATILHGQDGPVRPGPGKPGRGLLRPGGSHVGVVERLALVEGQTAANSQPQQDAGAGTAPALDVAGAPPAAGRAAMAAARSCGHRATWRAAGFRVPASPASLGSEPPVGRAGRRSPRGPRRPLPLALGDDESGAGPPSVVSPPRASGADGTAQVLLTGIITDPPILSTRASQPGASRARASSNLGPARSIQPGGNNPPIGTWSVFQCTGTAQ